MAIDANEQIEKFQTFFDEEYKHHINDSLIAGKKFLIVDFFDLSKYDHELAEELLEQPDETIKAAEIAIAQSDLNAQLRVRIKNLPESQKCFIRNLRSTHLDKFICIEGLIRQASDVRPKVVSARFECPSCNNVITILQTEMKFREPHRCSCGRNGNFKLLSKELIDAQRIVLEELSHALDSGGQPRKLAVFIREDLVDPRMEKRTTPGTNVRVSGVLTEIPVPTKDGGTSTTYDIVMNANYLEPIEEDFSDITIKSEDIEVIKKLAADKNIYRKLINSIAPNIYGHELIKEAVALQLFGASKKMNPDNTSTRGDIHILLVGDPGCIAGDSQVALAYKGMNKIQNLGNGHMQPIREAVTKIRNSPNDKAYDFATTFHHYPQQPVLKVVTESGKEIVCTYNQPFLTKEGWKRADELFLCTKVRVMPKIPSIVKDLIPTNFERVEKSTGPLKEVSLPEKFTPELAALCGYIIGDGHINKRGYCTACYVNDEETDLIEKLTMYWQNTFNVIPSVYTQNRNGSIKLINDGNGFVREIVSTQVMHVLEINSRQIASSLAFLSSKRVPQQIFQSPKQVIASFISWLFDADGCVFANGRGRTSIQLKSRTAGLLHDVQLLFLYFGIHSRIISDNLCIRRADDMELFAKYIGFNSEKKKQKLNHLLESLKERNITQRRKVQRYERVVKVVPDGIMDVYDFEVPDSQRFIANGIVVHNSGKSQILMFVKSNAPKVRYVAGKSASGVGLTGAIVKDEFLKGYALEAGAIVLAHKGLLAIDEMDKMSKEDTAALHEALEQQQISFAKANIQATLRCETAVLAAANPKFGRFDPYAPIASQIELPPALINRFDLLFIVRDKPDKERDSKIAHMILQKSSMQGAESEINSSLMRKYIAYAKQNVRPVLTKEALEEIKKFYVELRNTGQAGDEKVRPIPISARQLEAIVRLAEASARIRLSDKATVDDARRGINLLRTTLMDVGIDPETGQLDIDRIGGSMPASERGKIMGVRDIIFKMDESGKRTIPVTDIFAEAMKLGIPQNKVEEALEKLKRSGDIFMPKSGFIQRI